jgi:transforming growth factor-beta-induced protein
MKKLLSLIMVLMLLLSIPVFSVEKDIVDIAVESDDFSVLVAALVEADLVDALRGDGPYTVFAPTDQAFTDLLTELDITAGDLLSHPQLSEVLLYHVVSGKIMSTDLSDGLTAETLNGELLTVDLATSVKINDSVVTTPDVEATNGVIHIIDKVLIPEGFKLEVLPETVVDIALSNDDFSILVTALQTADLVDVLQGEGPFTVFAPTNDAFVQLLGDLNVTPQELLDHPDLAKVLLYHVVSGKVMSTDLVNGLETATINGETIAFDLTDGVKVNNVNVVLADLEAENGVVHVIDYVLVPSNFNYQLVEEGVEEAEEMIPATGVTSIYILSTLSLLSIVGFILARRKQFQ